MVDKVADINLPRDQDGIAAQVLGLSTIVNDDVDGTTDNSAIPSGSDIIEISVLEDTYILIGDSGDSVSATTGHLLNKGTYVYRVLETQTHVHYIQASTAGRITIAKLV